MVQAVQSSSSLCQARAAARGRRRRGRAGRSGRRRRACRSCRRRSAARPTPGPWAGRRPRRGVGDGAGHAAAQAPFAPGRRGCWRWRGSAARLSDSPASSSLTRQRPPSVGPSRLRTSTQAGPQAAVQHAAAVQRLQGAGERPGDLAASPPAQRAVAGDVARPASTPSKYSMHQVGPAAARRRRWPQSRMRTRAGWSSSWTSRISRKMVLRSRSRLSARSALTTTLAAGLAVPAQEARRRSRRRRGCAAARSGRSGNGSKASASRATARRRAARASSQSRRSRAAR